MYVLCEVPSWPNFRLKYSEQRFAWTIERGERSDAVHVNASIDMVSDNHAFWLNLVGDASEMNVLHCAILKKIALNLSIVMTNALHEKLHVIFDDSRARFGIFLQLTLTCPVGLIFPSTHKKPDLSKIE